MKKRSVLVVMALLACLLAVWSISPASRAVAMDGRALLIQLDLPWGANSNETILTQLVTDGYFSGFDTRSATQVSETSFDLSVYKMVLFANDQSQVSYNQYNTVLKEKLEAFAFAGGVVVFGACDAGWNGGYLNADLPGNIRKMNENESNNVIAEPNNPIVTGELSGRDPLTNADLYGSFCSHISFLEESLPDGSIVILRAAVSGKPTLVDYPHGDGHIIASGLTWEYSYNTNLPFAIKAYPDLMIYALRVAQGDFEGQSVLYDGNGATTGLAPVDEQAYPYGATVNVLGNTGSLVRTGYTFSG